MSKSIIQFFITCSLILPFSGTVWAQEIPDQNDTFFLAKKKGLLGRFGKSISVTPPDDKPIRLENPFLKYKGKFIRSIETIRLGFEYNIDDTTEIKKSIGITLGKLLHKKTTYRVVMNNLFFKAGDLLSPLILADNERYLRNLTFIKDARILVEPVEGSDDYVDVFVITKDVFSIGGRLSVSSKDKGQGELSEDNLLGTGNKLLFSGYYETPRSPEKGFGAEFIKRNIKGSFINWITGYKDYGNAFTSDRNQETVAYSRLEKPLVSPYLPGTGALEWTYVRTRNVYDLDSFYQSDIKYSSYSLDGWGGYSLDSRRIRYANKEIRVHRFLAIRGFRQQFLHIPTRYKTTNDYRFTDFIGGLASLNIFTQTFYKTSFIYGFGRSEDIPVGFNVALTGGYVKKQNLKRPYLGLDVESSSFKNQKLYSAYTFKIGGYFNRNHFNDVNILAYVNHFTSLKKLSPAWFNRTFISAGITAQVNPALNTPLFLNSEAYGLPYLSNGNLSSDLRATVKAETVFYNTTKFLGFRLAPFLFSDVILLKPSTFNLKHSDIFTAVGGGLRTRNENLVFGTIELRGFYFPRVIGDAKNWKIELSSNIRFRFKSSFISRPDFIIPN